VDTGDARRQAGISRGRTERGHSGVVGLVRGKVGVTAVPSARCAAGNGRVICKMCCGQRPWKVQPNITCSRAAREQCCAGFLLARTRWCAAAHAISSTNGAYHFLPILAIDVRFSPKTRYLYIDGHCQKRQAFWLLCSRCDQRHLAVGKNLSHRRKAF
jgi:hypothetical protein